MWCLVGGLVLALASPVVSDPPEARPGRSVTGFVSGPTSGRSVTLPATQGGAQIYGDVVRIVVPAPGRYPVHVTSMVFAPALVLVAPDGKVVASTIAMKPGDTASLEVDVPGPVLFRDVLAGACDGTGGYRIRVDKAVDPEALERARAVFRNQGFLALLARVKSVDEMASTTLALDLWPDCLRRAYIEQALHSTPYSSPANEPFAVCLASLPPDVVLAAAKEDRSGMLAVCVAAHWFQRGDLSGADQFLGVALSSDLASSGPLGIPARMSLVNMLGIRGREAEALLLIDALLEEEGEFLAASSPSFHVHALQSRALMLKAAGRWDEAVETARLVLDAVDRCADFLPEDRGVAQLDLALMLVTVPRFAKVAEAAALLEGVEASGAAFLPYIPGGADGNRLNAALIALACGDAPKALGHLAAVRDIDDATGFSGTGLARARATALWTIGDAGAARDIVERSLLDLDDLLDRALASLSDAEKLQFAGRWRDLLSLALTLSTSVGPGVSREGDYAHVLAFKGRVARRVALERAALRASDDPRVRDLGAAVAAAAVREKSARLAEDAPAYRAAAAERRASEAELAQRLRAEESRFYAASLSEALPPDTASVDIVRYDRAVRATPGQPAYPVETHPHYAAFVIRGARAGVARVELGPAEPIDAAAREWLGAMTTEVSRGRPPRLERTGRDAVLTRLVRCEDTLGRAVLAPLLAASGDARRWVVSPDGELCFLPLDALALPDGRRVVEQYEVLTIPDLGARPGPAISSRAGAGEVRSALIVGDVAFGRDVTPLPGTLVEALRIAALHRATFLDSEGPVLLHGDGATADEVSRAIPGHRYVHLATHGFFTAETSERVSSSGLFFAALPGEERSSRWVEDDAMWLDGRNAELIVLSACASGLGSPVPGEGALGLRRSLRMAGVRTVVSALWPIGDAATVPFMEAFYRRLWKEGEPPSSALRGAKLEILRDARLRGEVHDGVPRWGAFVCEGWPEGLGRGR